ncbi:hypothetical protein L873DRAFT_1149266 [Choiromyces venosus 120613-1]|uniref:Uncharacterized protein n=1 Tax=Choiromyces venosus 120613-1 TaxID=1336337 RepID=A0A3N4JTT2_9PEZI|nr:hypothetical protein L873DRAFT_1149266 [Choiromyces venosus 120613-1]
MRCAVKFEPLACYTISQEPWHGYCITREIPIYSTTSTPQNHSLSLARHLPPPLQSAFASQITPHPTSAPKTPTTSRNTPSTLTPLLSTDPLLLAPATFSASVLLPNMGTYENSKPVSPPRPISPSTTTFHSTRLATSPCRLSNQGTKRAVYPRQQ